MREVLKAVARAVAFVAILPALASFAIRSTFMGRDRALEGSTQLLALIPGLAGQYMRRAFLGQTLARCHPTAAICFGTIFSQTQARIDERVYIGPGCTLGLVHVECDVLIGSGVHVTSGREQHGTSELDAPIRDQQGQPKLVSIGAGTWIGSAAVIMADVGRNSIVGAGAVVTNPLPDWVVAAGVPARIIRHRRAQPHNPSREPLPA